MIGADNSFQIGVVYNESVTNQIIEAASEILGKYIDIKIIYIASLCRIRW